MVKFCQVTFTDGQVIPTVAVGRKTHFPDLGFAEDPFRLLPERISVFRDRVSAVKVLISGFSMIRTDAILTTLWEVAVRRSRIFTIHITWRPLTARLDSQEIETHRALPQC
jgi:hypothetical protein